MAVPATHPAIVPPSPIIMAPPGASPLEARLATLAQSMGLRLQPAAYTATFRDAARPGSVEVQPQTQDGVFIVTRLRSSSTSLVSDAGAAEVDIRIGSNRFAAGTVRLDDFAAATGGAAWGEGALPAPIIMARKDTLVIEVKPIEPTATTVVGQGFAVSGFHVRTADLERVDRETGQGFADVIGDEGVLWMVGLAGRETGLLQSVNQPMVVQRMMLATDSGDDNAVRMRVSLGNVQVTPGADGIDAAVVRSLGGRLYQDGIAWAMESADVVAFDPAYETDAAAPVQSRCLLVGRSPRR